MTSAHNHKAFTDTNVEYFPPPLLPIALGMFLKLDIPPRQMVLGPIIAEKSINMIYGPRGCGKTHLVVGIALAVAAGNAFLRWSAPKPCRVLIIDGEMPGAVLIERLSAATQGLDNFSFAETGLVILASDLCADGLPDLGTAEGQEAFAPHLEGFDLIIIDNISTLCRTGKENEADSWGMLQNWALAQRRAGRSVLFVHHAGKGGDQRGTSRREDVMDTVIKLSRPSDYEATEGARMVIEFTKARGIIGDGAEPFEAQLRDGAWSICLASTARDQRIIQLHCEGLHQREIAKEADTSPATVNRVIKRYKSGVTVADNDG